MKLRLTNGELGEDRKKCHILRACVEKDEQVEPYVLQQSLRQLCETLTGDRWLGSDANAVVLKLGELESTPWVVGMATAAMSADTLYPRVAVFVTAPNERERVMCIAQGDMEHYAPGYMNTTRTFPLTESEEVCG